MVTSCVGIKSTSPDLGCRWSSVLPGTESCSRAARSQRSPGWSPSKGMSASALGATGFSYAPMESVMAAMGAGKGVIEPIWPHRRGHRPAALAAAARRAGRGCQPGARRSARSTSGGSWVGVRAGPGASGLVLRRTLASRVARLAGGGWAGRAKTCPACACQDLGVGSGPRNGVLRARSLAVDEADRCPVHVL